jgi:hypothetical protein
MARELPILREYFNDIKVNDARLGSMHNGM